MIGDMQTKQDKDRLEEFSANNPQYDSLSTNSLAEPLYLVAFVYVFFLVKFAFRTLWLMLCNMWPLVAIQKSSYCEQCEVQFEACNLYACVLSKILFLCKATPQANQKTDGKSEQLALPETVPATESQLLQYQNTMRLPPSPVLSAASQPTHKTSSSTPSVFRLDDKVFCL